eukprot:GSChrysophyteH1.ASY1.ANO1.1120.1 assembled CDS
MPSKPARGSLFYVVKLNKSSLSDNIGNEVIFGDIAADPLEHMATLSQRVFHPMVSSNDCARAWTETIAKEVRDNFETFVANIQITQGHVRGVTCLPLPSDTEEKAGEFQQIHALEGAIITWTKQIKNVLKKDSESVFQALENPGPIAEVEFWVSKASNLNGIFDQLQSPRVRRVLKILDRSKSTYNAPFAKLCKEVFHARAEANNIVKYLRPLVAWFNGLENETDFERLVHHFRPIMHLVLLVWKSSSYYNTTSRLVILMREICNTVIKQASTFVNGDAIFELIEAGETVTAVKMLQTLLRVLGRFKTTYFDYKAKASVECPENPWRVQNNAVFIRLDSFLERCHDILDLAQTILQFSKLAKVEVGGTKGKTLSTSVAQIYFDFVQAIETVKSVGKGILDLENKEFDDAFYDFRSRMKELDRRLASVLVQGFDDTATLSGRFRLFDTFDNLIVRPIIADELEKKYSPLITGVKSDTDEVNHIFMEHKDSPLIASNLPPISGALAWCRGLQDRIQFPIEKLKALDKKVMEREDTRDMLKIYTALIGQMADFDRERIESWGRSIEDSSQAKLKNPLLRRELLREVKYFLLLGLEVPASAMEIYAKVEVFRRQTGNLDLIVNMYNNIQEDLLPVERPLVKSQLEKLDKTLAMGIGEGKSKSKSLNWKSNGIDLFIEEAMAESREVSELLQMLKGNLKHIEGTVESWSKDPLFERGGKTQTIDDFLQLQKKQRAAKLTHVKESGQDVHRLLKDTNKKLKVSQGLPDWKAYVDFINSIVVYGLIGAMAMSLRAMGQQLNPDYLQSQSLPPLLEIQLDLVDKKTMYSPEVGYPKQMGIPNIVATLINGMLGLTSAFKRLDTAEGTYIRELTEAPEVQVQRTKVTRLLMKTEKNANKLRTAMRKFEHLWKSDAQKLFGEFQDAEQNTNTEDRAEKEPETIINLNLFGEEIQKYLDIQAEISEIKVIHEIDFLKVNAQPVKQAILSWVTKWLYTYTQYLQTYLSDQLTGLYQFNKDVNIGLDKEVVPGNRKSLMDVMTIIRDVRKRLPEIAALFEPLKNIVGVLKAKSIPIDLPPIDGQSALDYLEQAKMFWDNTVNKTYRVKEAIQPLQNSMLDNIRKEIKRFDADLSKFVKEFKSNGPFLWIAEKQRDAYVSLDKYQKQLSTLTEKSKGVNELEDLFELPLSHHKQLYEVKDDLIVLKNLWDVILLNQLKKQPKKPRGWQVFKSLDMQVKNLALTLPLIHDLHSPAMRDRHWKALMVLTGVSIDRGPNNVSEIVEDVWGKFSLNFDRHRDTETLEEHALHLQSMAGMGKFVEFFRDRVVGWQGTLGEVETTLKMIIMVERQWGALESIFLGSADIRAQLPDDTKTFEAVDSDFKELMALIQTRPQKSIFPRFYFVSNAALLDILSNGNNLPKITPHVGSVFDGEEQVKLEEAAMISKDQETVPFTMMFEMHGAVENWLNDLVGYMQTTLREVLVNSIADAGAWELDRPREEWIFNVPAQIALVTSQIIWTEEVEAALEDLEGGADDAVKKYVETCNGRLEGLIRLVQGELSPSDRVKIITVITIDVHSRDVVQSLVAKKVENNVDFKWQSQLRYYWIPEEKTVNIRICDFATVCYVTLTVALRLMLGGAPAGPAGTGKTETTKDLARGLGLPCYVFNCSDQMNYQTMGDIFKGLTQVGAWGCFDEFNRIEIEVLSVVASQVRGLPAGTPPVKVGYINFFGDNVALVPTVGLFITMNPGYAGRTELPENLKALFRSCAMISPDFLPISENMLMAEGFQHYDWGLRAIKSVLRVAGMLKRADPEFEEEAILMRALRDFNTPKIPSNDIPIFLRLIADLFPGLDLLPKELFLNKIAQLDELLAVRHSVMLLGPAGCGKTCTWKSLISCRNLDKPKPVATYDTVNPKSVNTDELYGYMTLSKDWRDGVLSIIMRNMSKNVSPYHVSQVSKWVVLDGDIDSIWIESMNTVMDDNKVLTLNATPATVSRAGILYINDTDVGYEPYILTWLASRTQELEKTQLPELFERYLGKIMEFFLGQKLETIRVFLFTAMWAFGGALAGDKQVDYPKQFSNFFKREGNCLDYFFDFSSGEPITAETGIVVVPTADTVRLTYLLDKLVKNSTQVMFVGSAGTGKTNSNINMNFYTDSYALQQQLEQVIDKRSGKTYGPAGGAKLVYFVDDLNLPFIETYGTQTPIALMHMSLKKSIVDCQYVSCMNHKSGSFFLTPMIQKFTDATINLHREVQAKFLPSAVKFHYNFTMRDLSARFMEDDPEKAYADPVSFTHFHASLNDDLGNYVACEDTTKLKTKLERLLEVYNENHSIMNLVLFENAMRHVCRIARILMFPGGNALLIGVGGSGKQSLSKLAASICKCDLNQIAVTSDFNINDFKENLKELYKKSGVKPGVPMVFMLTDTQVVDERFLVYINDLLSSGRIPDLFTKEEYDGIFTSLRNIAKAEGIPDNRDSMMSFFINRVRANLHVILCFSPVGDSFRQRSRKFPGIINCTAIDWFQEWPKDALVSVAQRFLEDIEISGKPETKDNIAYHIAEVHASVGVASQEYLRRREQIAAIDRLDTGLNTLMRTNKDVEQLQEFLKVKQKEVEGKKAACDVFLEEMEQAAGDLAVAKPALMAANDAVNCLDKASMTELRSFTKPPNGVDKVTTTLLIMIKGEKRDFSWENAKKMMAKVDAFKEKLENYKGENIDEDFNYTSMKSKSAAAANLCNWVRVKPLMDSLAVAQAARSKAEADLAIVKEQLDVIEATQDKAARLTSGLASEKVRWGATVDSLKNEEITLAGNVMLAAAFTSYLGAFGIEFRKKLWSQLWLADLKSRDVPLSEGVDPLWVLTSESECATWQNEGLPADRISIENGAMVTNSTRWPLLIDPQLQGIRWLKAHFTAAFILENVGQELDPALDPILSKAVYRKGRTLFLKVGDDDVEYDESFRFCLQTKQSNPHYKPEIAAQCTLINFIVTKKGLEDQLLATIVGCEEPELEETRNRLANAPEDILSDIPLIEGLEATKETVTEINEAVTKGKQTEIGINTAREVYRIVATEASLLYFVMLQLCYALKAATDSSDKVERVKNLQTTLRWTIFKWVVRGLFEKHRLIFLTQLTLALMIQESPISWLTDISWAAIRNLALLEDFEKLPGDIEENPQRFLEWYTHFTPEIERIPGDWRELDKQPFKKLQLLSSFQIVESSFSDSTPLIPMYFILSAGANPVTKGESYHIVSLGQGQDGHWVMLMNVHLMPRWLPVTSDPPSGLKANLKQAFASFSREMYEELEPRTKGILFGLCQFHAVMVERKKFGAKGYNMMYPFAIGDLNASATVLRNYMESAPAKVPWADLRYLFGEIMYGGHIVNSLDRLLANTYLDFYMREELLDEMPLFPFMEPVRGGAEEDFRAPAETPLAFGLHPNAEIGFRTDNSEELLRVILELSASAGSDGGDAQSSQQVAEAAIQDILDQYRDTKFELDQISGSVEEVGPFQNIVLQECERMNALISEIVRSLVELDLGFRGELTVSDKMDDLATSLFLDRVPKGWETLAWPSLRGLALWLSDFAARIAQLNDWAASPGETPSFLTAVMQTTAQKDNLELDKLTLVTDITKKMLGEEMTTVAKEGTYIVGLKLEGGSWNLGSGLLEPSKPREMYTPLPTQSRGPTYVFSLQLRTKADPAKWVLAGVVAVMDVI